jgi:hypothetical protein
MYMCETRYLPPTLYKNSKWVKYLNIRPKPLKLSDENIGKTLEDIDIGKDFLNSTLMTQERARTDNQNCIRIKKFCTSKDTITRERRQSTEWC